jgi:uncharacterized protein (TIGR00255 family)
MTGFGKAVAELPDKKVTVEIKSLNSKQLDLNVRIPSAYREKEMQLRNEVMQSLERGKIDLVVGIENIGSDTSTQINRPLFASYLEQGRAIAAQMHIAEPTDWFAVLLRLPDMVKSDAASPGDDEWTAVHGAFREAVRLLIDFRIQEGAMLQRFFEEKADRIAQLLRQTEAYEEERIEKIKNRIAEGLNRLGETDYDRNRFEQEMLYYIEKLDVTEEKKRLDNHLKYFADTLRAPHGQGKKLGFIVQEIGREINTLGSKSNHAAMQQLVVAMKDELEQVREQVLNAL